MSKSDDEWYNKGYDDGFSDAINNLQIEDVIEWLKHLDDEEKKEVLKNINVEVNML